MPNGSVGLTAAAPLRRIRVVSGTAAFWNHGFLADDRSPQSGCGSSERIAVRRDLPQEVGAAAGTRPAEDRGEVRFHGRRREAQRISDLSDAAAGSHGLQNPDLAGRQLV